MILLGIRKSGYDINEQETKSPTGDLVSVGLEKTKKELSRGRNEKAIKYFDKIIKILKQEIKKNLRNEDDDKDEEMGHKKRKIIIEVKKKFQQKTRGC